MPNQTEFIELANTSSQRMHFASAQMIPADLRSRYHLAECLGSGASSSVYRAHDLVLGRDVALKILRCDAQSEAAIAGLLLEAQLLAKVAHPNVVTIHDAGRVGEQLYLAMELTARGTLRDLMRKPQQWQQMVRTFIEVGKGLAAVHQVGVVHRDFKPENVFIDSHGQPRVGDFGLAAELRSGAPVFAAGSVRQRFATGTEVPPLRATVTEPFAAPLPAQLDAVSQTLALPTAVAAGERVANDAEFVGTPAYMALEQFAGFGATAASDQFAFCVALFEALTGRRPFSGDNLQQLQDAIAGQRYEWPSRPRIPNAVRRIVARGLAADAAARWPSMPALLAALAATLRATQRRTYIAVGGASLVAAGAIGWFVHAQAVAQPSCAADSTALQVIWNPQIAAKLNASLSALHAGYGASTAIHIRKQLDDYSRAWATKHRSICETTEVAGSQSRADAESRLFCMRNLRFRFTAVVDVLHSASARSIERAIDLVHSLPAVRVCDDASNEAAERALMAFGDNSEAARILGQVAQVNALAGTGDATKALAIVEQLANKAKAIGNPALLSMVASAHARAALSVKGPVVSRAFAVNAEQEAERAGIDRLRAEALLIQAVLAGYGPVADGQALIDKTVVLAERLGDVQMRHKLIMAQAEWYGMQRELQRAIDVLEQELAMTEAAFGPASPATARLYERLQYWYKVYGKSAKSLEYAERYAAMARDVYGEHHPTYAAALHERGIAQMANQFYDDGLRTLQQALQLAEKSAGAPVLAGQLHEALAQSYLRVGDLPSATKHAARAVTVARMIGDSFVLMRAVMSASEVARRAGKLSEALDAAKEAEALIAKAPARKFEAIFVGTTVARLLADMGKFAEAEAALVAPRALLAQLSKDDNRSAAVVMYSEAYVAAAAGQTAQAIALYDKAIAQSDDSAGGQESRMEMRMARALLMCAQRKHPLVGEIKSWQSKLTAASTLDKSLDARIDKWTQHCAGKRA